MRRHDDSSKSITTGRLLFEEQWERDADVDGTTKEFSTDEDKMDCEIAGCEQDEDDSSIAPSMEMYRCV